MPAIKHEAFFRRHPVFTGEELAAHLCSNGDAGARTQESLLAYHTRAGRLLRVRRGLFAVIPPGADSNTNPVDPYLVAAKLTGDSVLSHHTALEFHGRAYSAWQQITYSASRPLDKLTFRSHDFRGTRFPEALRQAAEHRLARLVQLGVRQSRYFGRAKTRFQLLMAATVANLTLVATKMGMISPAPGSSHDKPDQQAPGSPIVTTQFILAAANWVTLSLRLTVHWLSSTPSRHSRAFQPGF